MNFEIRESMVIEWAKQRGILDSATPKDQMMKLVEELGELAGAIAKKNEPVIVDSLGDLQVVLIILHRLLGYDMGVTLDTAIQEIINRKGKMIDGVFVKESDL